MEQRLKVSPDRQSESVESWRKKGGGPWALVTPAESDLVSVLVSAAAADVVAALVMMMARKRGREDGGLIVVSVLFVFQLWCGSGETNIDR